MIALEKDKYKYIEHNPTWDVLDSTKSDAYMTCPRFFFFNYVLGWRGVDPNIHLIHGEAHHRAQEIILKSNYNLGAVDQAMEAYEEYYREFFGPHMDDVNYPKIPGVERDILINYISLYIDDMDRYEIIQTETGGAIPISEEDVIWFRMDSVMFDKHRDQYLSMEHKTGSRNSETWRQKWWVKFQVGTYTHALYYLYPIEKVYGVKINGIFYYKKGVSEKNFVRIPCEKTPQSMALWLNTAQRVCAQMKYDFALLAECDPDESYLEAFPPYPISCESWFGCKYIELCSAWPNPLKHADDPPIGLAVDFWDPRKKAEEAKNQLEAKEDKDE